MRSGQANSKFQTISKSKIQMTKTVLNFENLDLKFVSDLVLGAWNLLNFGIFAKVE